MKFPLRIPAFRHRAPIAAALALGCGLLSPVHADRPRAYAITGARVTTAPGSVLETATVVVRDGLIEAVGPDVEIPDDAEQIDAADGWVYPGLIDLHSRLRLDAGGGTSTTRCAPRSRSAACRRATTCSSKRSRRSCAASVASTATPTARMKSWR